MRELELSEQSEVLIHYGRGNDYRNGWNDHVVRQPPSEESAKMYRESVAAISEGFCPVCKVPLGPKGWCGGWDVEKATRIREEAEAITADTLNAVKIHQMSWWHLCPDKNDPGNPDELRVVQTYFYFEFGFPPPCDRCDKGFTAFGYPAR